MKIGMYAHWNVSRDGQRLRLLGCNARHLRYFLQMTDGVRLFTPVVPASSNAALEEISHPRLEVVAVPGGSYASVWRRQRQLRQILARNLDGLDAVYVRLFDPCPWLFAPLCEARGIGLVYDLVSDPIQGIFHRSDWTWLGRWARRCLFLPEELLTFRAARRHTLLINGGELTRIFGRRHPCPQTIFSSTLEEAEFYHRADTCTTEPVVLSYAGVLRPAKRLETLIDATAELVRQHRPVVLRLVGGGEPASYVDTLRRQVDKAGLRDRVTFVGHVLDLNVEYRAADIYAFPSLTEGAARTLLEAASQSLPCVMTDVGGARDLFVDEQSALIVPPDNSPALARAIARFLDEPELRRRCIRNAYAMAAGHLCRDFIRGMVGHLNEAQERAKRLRTTA